MARVEGFTYNGHVVGTAAPTSTTEIVGGRFGWDNAAEDGDETDVFVCEFIVKGTSAADLETKCQIVRAALRAKNQALSVDWANNIATYNPAVATASGWDGRPSLRKLRRPTTDVGYIRGFEFRCRVQVPSNYTDPNLTGQDNIGRRTSSVRLRWDSGTRRVVTIEGKFHLTANSLPRAKTTTAASNNPSGTIDTYCVARLAKIDPAAQWTIGSRVETDNNTQTEMVFSREYYETIAGRFVATPEIAFAGSRLRQIIIRGTFFRTYSATYNGGAVRSATTNYADAVTGGVKYAETQLAALPAALGSPLTPGTNCELISEHAVPNDQDDRLDYILVYQELNFKQSNAATSLDDPDIINDRISYLLDYTPLDDSPVPAAGGAGGPNPFAGVPSLEGNGSKPNGTGSPGTLDKSVVPPVNPLGGNHGERDRSGALPTKPVMLKIEYNAEIKKTVSTNKLTKWYAIIRPWLLGQWAAQLGFSPVYLLGDHFDESVQDNRIRAFVVAVAMPGSVISYKLEEGVIDEIGEAIDPALTGTPYEALVQQELPKRNKVRRHQIVYKSGSFDPSTLFTQSATPGYRVSRRAVTGFNEKMVGISGLGLGLQSLTAVSFMEEMEYVARNVGDPPGAPPNGAAVASQGPVATPDNPGGN